jgi:hypothetical protein
MGHGKSWNSHGIPPNFSGGNPAFRIVMSHPRRPPTSLLTHRLPNTLF